MAPPQVTVLGARPVPDPTFSIWEEPVLYILIVIISVVGLMVAIGTAYDIILQRRNQQNVEKTPGPAECNGNHLTYTSTGPEQSTKPETESTNKTKQSTLRPGLFSQCVLCFSAWSNLRKICDTRTEDSLACIHGMRVLSLLWVIAGHTCMFTFPISDNKGFRQLVEQDFLFQSISNGAFSVDTFFFLSGVMVSYVFFKNTSKNNTKEDISTVQMLKNNSVRFLGVFSYRYLRLTPPYLFILMVTQLNSRWFYYNAVMHNPFLVRDQSTCPDYWWRNALYINTLFPVKDMCMIWSWYLANDTQFYTLGILLLLVSAKYFKLAVTSMFTFLVSSWFTTAVIVLNTHHMPSIEEPLGLFDELYDKPWTRLGPYVIGMCAGWILHTTNCKIKMHKALVVIGWALSIAMSFVLVHGLYGDLGPIMSAAYVALSHTAWAIAVAWIVIACTTGNGGYVNKVLSCKFLYPLSRITYCAYLVHPLVMISVIMHLDSPMHLARASMIIVIFGYFCTSYMLSLIVSLGFEAPTISLLNILHPIKRKLK
ncbi:hypothetical protein L9F63_022477 [Diploptera punctata]|uniref:Acyltransferase 3 domain-containing protein n=1 Tax=Diploptera punctata TaxID=6984 RepID=A0AAD7ZML4_DIPPU|nr:hypothetical protein L9F63_022477 [Diploptera punctata]